MTACTVATAHSHPLCSFSVDRWSPHRGLNSGPHSYQECALPLSYVGSRLGQLQRAVRAKPEGPHARSTALGWCREEDSNLRSTRRQIYSLLGLTAPQSLHRLISYHTNNQQHNPVTKIVTQQTQESGQTGTRSGHSNNGIASALVQSRAASLATILEPRGGFEPANLPITNRLRCRCATGARDRQHPDSYRNRINFKQSPIPDASRIECQMRTLSHESCHAVQPTNQ